MMGTLATVLASHKIPTHTDRYKAQTWRGTSKTRTACCG